MRREQRDPMRMPAPTPGIDRTTYAGAPGATAPGTSARHRLSTADVAPRDAVRYWAESVCEGPGLNWGIRPRSAEFRSALEHFSADGVGFTKFNNSARDLQRTRSMISQDGVDSALLVVQVRGRTRVSQDDRVAILTDGSMTFLDSSRPSVKSCGEDSVNLIVQVPRALLPRRTLATATGINLGPDSPGSLVREFLLGLERQQLSDPAAVAELLPSAIGLIDSALSFAAREAPAPASVLALNREHIHRFIALHADDPHLDAGMAAAACGMSRRTLFRALESEGRSFTSLVRDARVAIAKKLLRRPEFHTLPVIAALSGFSGEAQLHRAFREVVGMTPGTYREAWHESS